VSDSSTLAKSDVDLELYLISAVGTELSNVEHEA